MTEAPHARTTTARGMAAAWAREDGTAIPAATEEAATAPAITAADIIEGKERGLP
jgi:hypothetical protein